MALLGSSNSTTTQTEQIADQLDVDKGEPESVGGDAALSAAGLSVLFALYEYYIRGNKHDGLFVGLWAPTILAFASYLKQRSMEKRLEQSLIGGSTMRTLRKLLE